MTFRLPLPTPPVTVQEPHQCWSAAYESWSTACSRIIPSAVALTEEEIERRVRETGSGYLDANGGATPRGIMAMSVHGRMDIETLQHGTEFTDALIRDRLTRFGYIYLDFYGHGRHGVFSHAVVIYGIHGASLSLMDPGPNRGLVSQPSAYYRRAIGMFVGTHKNMH